MPPPPGPPGPPPGPPPGLPPLGDEPPAPEPARPGWRTVVKRPEPRRKGKAAAAPPPPPPPPAIEAARPELPSWAQWRRKHALQFDTPQGNFVLIYPAFYSKSEFTACCPWPHALAGRCPGASPSGPLWCVCPCVVFQVFIRADIYFAGPATPPPS